MSFGLGVICYILGSVLVGVCLWCIPGPAGAAAPPPRAPGHGHGSH